MELFASMQKWAKSWVCVEVKSWLETWWRGLFCRVNFKGLGVLVALGVLCEWYGCVALGLEWWVLMLGSW